MNKGKVLTYLVIFTLLLLIIVPLIISSSWRNSLKSTYQWTFGGEVQAEAGFYYTCPMHPQIKLPQPGDCPICGMSLVKKQAGGEEERKGEIVVTPTQIQLAGIRSEPVKQRHLIKEIDTVGLIDYDEREIAYVSAWVGGRIDKLFVDFTGVTIQKGHPLVSLYSPSLISTQEEYLRAINTLKEVSESKIPETVESAKNLVESTRQRLLWWGIAEEQIDELEKTNKVQSHLVIKAPIGGTVIHKNVFEGMYVKEGTHLFKIVDMSTMWLYADIYESEISILMAPQADDYYQCPMHPEVKQPGPGDCSICQMPLLRHSPEIKVEITTEAYPDEVFTGEIEFADPFVNPRTRTLRIRCSIKNPELKLRANMYARARIFINVKEILALPENAVIHSGKRNIIMIDKGEGVFEPRLVRLGRKWLYEEGQVTTETTALPFHRGMQRYHEILDGVTENEKVVSPASFLLNSEAQIQGALEKMLGGEKEKPKEKEHAYCAWDGMKMKTSVFKASGVYGRKTLYFCSIQEKQKYEKNKGQAYYTIITGLNRQVEEVLLRYFHLTKALSSDNQSMAEKYSSEIYKLTDSLSIKSPGAIMKKRYREIEGFTNSLAEASMHLTHSKNNKERRKMFENISNLLRAYFSEFAQDYIKQGKVFLFYCPMVEKYWLQEDNKETANPYDPGMPKCGGPVEWK